MGLRATIITKYEVEYGNANGFNYDAETLDNIINEYCTDFYNDECSYSTIWEINKKEFADMIEKINAMSEDEFNQKMCEEWFEGTFSDDKMYSKKYVLDKFQSWLNETPAKSNYVRLAWL